MEPSDNKQDELIEVRMPRGDYEVLRGIIVREKSLSWLGGWLRTGLVVTLGTFLVFLISINDKVRSLF